MPPTAAVVQHVEPQQLSKARSAVWKGYEQVYMYMFVVLFILSYLYTIATLVDVEEVPLRGELERLCVGLTRTDCWDSSLKEGWGLLVTMDTMFKEVVKFLYPGVFGFLGFSLRLK